MKKKTAPVQPDTTGESQINSSNEIMSMLDDAPDRAPPHFPIIGIGTSAGGLEALELFFNNMPSASDKAFVIVQHLDPTHKSIIVELLQRATPLPVVEVSDDLVVEPGRIYVIPPNKDMSILHGVLYLFPPTSPRGLRLPIDYFFLSLAEDLQERSVGVILSGMGSDGTLGLRAIKEKAGAVFVQDPATAKFNGMPRSAIDAGLADVVAPVEELPGRISAYLQQILVLSKTNQPLESKIRSALEKILILIRSQTGHDFSRYKRTTIYRRVEHRMSLHQIDKITSYLRYMQENPQEIDLLFNELLIGVTNFFRDPPAWAYLQNEVLPGLLASHPQGGMLRAWTPGCSTGEEAYSLAMLFRETIDRLKPEAAYSLQIFATDLDQDAVEKARQGIYPANITADVSPDRLHRFFIQEDNNHFRVGKEMREMVIFATQNLIMDPPFTRLDLLVCRNLLIYLGVELQKMLMPIFHHCLNPGGILFLGNAETIGAFSNLFSLLEGKQRLYRRLDLVLPLNQVDFPPPFYTAGPNPPNNSFSPAVESHSFPNLQLQVEKELLQHFSPAAALVNDTGDILYISGRTGKYLEPAVGKVNWNIFAMAREGLRYKLNTAFQQSLREKAPVTIKNLVVDTNGGAQAIDLTIRPQEKPGALHGTVLVVFSDVPPHPTPIRPPGKNRRTSDSGSFVEQMEQESLISHEEIKRTQEELQNLREEMQTSQEELKSTNEELQSTNEELTTSKEEMQSMNEELQTVNHELESRVEDLSRSNNDMKNLLDSTDIATLFLDEALNIRIFTSQAARIINLIPADTGRSILDITSRLIYPELVEDAQKVLVSLIPVEKQVPASDGHWFIVRMMPYRTLENRINGVVITFIDITISRTLEDTLREALSVLQSHFTDQATQLDTARTAETVLQKAQAILQKRLADQTIVLSQAREDLQTEKDRHES